MDLSKLPIEGSFRLRGRDVTRLESFVDASFAFSLTLLVIFFNDLPETIAELRTAMRRVPTFAACFVLLMLFWSAHNRWSRRFGLEDARSTVLSLALVLTVMIYVYPLRMVTSSGLSIVTAGWVPNELGGLGENWLLDLQTAFMVYSVGFAVLSWILWRLNAHALGKAEALMLNSRERYDTGTEIGMHRIATLAAAVSLALSAAVLMVGPDRASAWVAGLPMWVYAIMGCSFPLFAWHRERRRSALQEVA
jgi:uncharacterized membrane protein